MSRRRQIPTIFSRGFMSQEKVNVQRRRDERGAAVVEFALILPVLVLFVFGIVEFGRAYSARIQLTAAVREGARAGALGGDVAAATRAGAPGLTATDISVIYNATPGSTCTPVGSSTTVTTATTVVGSTTTTTIPTATVTATYPFKYDIPLFRSGTWMLSATGVMRCGG
jgi:Flp pilus assembly protein TadG